MVRQQLFRVDAAGGRTIAVSADMRCRAWLSLLDQQLSLIDFSALSASVYYQYPLGRGIVLSRCAVNPYTPEKSCIAHQLVFDEAQDIDDLLRVRPMKENLLPAGIFGYSATPDPLPSLSVADMGDPEELLCCRETLSSLFGGGEALLGRFLSALSLCARDKRHSVRAFIPDTPENVSEAGRRIMELTLRALSREDVLRLSYCSLAINDLSGLQYTVCFAPAEAKPDAPDPFEMILDLESRALHLPQDTELPQPDFFAARAHELLHWADHSGAAPEEHAPAAGAPHAFEEGMSLKQRFAEWRGFMETRKAQLTDEGFRAFAQDEWPKLVDSIVAASDLMDTLKFLSELNGILAQIRREKLETSLMMSDSILTDMIILLLDSIRWRQIDLSLPQVNRLIRSVTAYSQVLTEELCPEDILLPCRIIHLVLTSPASIHEALMDLDRLEDISPAQFEALQDCLLQYVQKRLTADIDVIDESLAAAAMLGFAKFSDGIPDLRLADKLAERIESQSGAKAAHRFEQMLDKLRRHLHSTHGGLIRRRDMKLFILISCLLLILIAGISIWFLLLA